MTDEATLERSAHELLAEDGLAKVKIDRRALSSMGGAQKALLFLVSLDEGVATRILAHLDDDEVRRLRDSSDMMTEAPPTAIKAVHHEFLARVRAGMPASLRGSHAYLRRLAGNALGEGRAAELWSDKPKSEGAAAIARLENGVLEALLATEQPQTVAVVLSQLPAMKASELVERMDPARRGDVMLRLAQLESVPEAVLRDIEQAFQVHVETLSEVQRREIAGRKAAADIVKRLPNEVGEELLEALRGESADAADAIEKALFTFEDLTRVDSRGMQQLLKEIPTDQLVLALKTASEELKEKVFGNVSSRAADLLHEELELLGPVRLTDVEDAQQSIIQTALELERDGRIAIAREGGGDYV
ncbi:MAG TPA: FliG C-terminal domain-containing protein [Sandaracinaceae bacterium LLY-WYZ-13_1]|nr:FliG C-terminal domain-containing protein [Sandaracinaceae bacterium LLY-WYZ-13_1]